MSSRPVWATQRDPVIKQNSWTQSRTLPSGSVQEEQLTATQIPGPAQLRESSVFVILPKLTILWSEQWPRNITLCLAFL